MLERLAKLALLVLALFPMLDDMSRRATMLDGAVLCHFTAGQMLEDVFHRLTMWNLVWTLAALCVVSFRAFRRVDENNQLVLGHFEFFIILSRLEFLPTNLILRGDSLLDLLKTLLQLSDLLVLFNSFLSQFFSFLIMMEHR